MLRRPRKRMKREEENEGIEDVTYDCGSLS